MSRRNFAVIAALVIGVAAPPAVAAVPANLSYQGVLTDGNGVVVQDGSYSLLFQIFDTPTAGAGTPVFGQELAVEVTDGLYNVILSTWEQGTLGRDLELAFQDAAPGRYMQVTIVDGPGATLDGAVLLPRQQIASVPFALVAARAAIADATAEPQAERLVLFTTSTYFANNRFGSGVWTPFLKQDGSGDMELVVQTGSDCIIEVAAGATLGDSSGPHHPLLTVMENGSPVGAPMGFASAADSGSSDDRSSAGVQYVNLSPAAQTTYSYKLGARSTPNVDQGGTIDGVASGAYLKVVMECLQ